MKILEYDEVDSQQVLELNIKSFGWFLSQDQVRFIRRVDSRTPDYVALYAVEGKEVQSQVGVVTLDTQTTYGTEKIGYIWGVATRPSQARQGFATKLMEEAHERLIGEGIRYSFLGTGKSLVAYDLYRRLGYKEFTMLKRGLKKCQNKESGEITLKTKVDKAVIVDLFYEYSEGLLGFVKRPRNFMEIRKAWSWFQYDLVGAFYENENPIGYIIANKEDKILKIWELCCPKKEDLKKSISSLKSNLNVEYIVLELVHKAALEEQFIESGFKIFDESWGVFMVKDLKGDQSIKEIRKIYRIDDKKFHMTPIDEY
jgi:ribosomal protein S18 acetylase RimI-like enzyme